MSITNIGRLFKRDPKRLKAELEAYTAEDKLWLSPEGISNYGGNLCRYKLENLNAFIGAELGDLGYIRQRELEFSQKDVPRAALIPLIENPIPMVDRTSENLPEKELCDEYPIVVFKEKMGIGYFLKPLATPLAYHFGQVDYHRRLLDQ